MKIIDFWFSSGSAYAYLSALRIDHFEKSSNVAFRFRPFYLVDIMLENGHVPFVNEPSKQSYMWRDLLRRGKLHGLSPVVPAPFPKQTKNNETTYLANRIACVALKRDWGRQYVQNTFRNWVERGYPPGEMANIETSMKGLCKDVRMVLTEAGTQACENTLQNETSLARRLGIFGSPTFVVGDELFWGDDRLEDAVRWSMEPWVK
ncbi:2-hydroxychromene-2-carboxylate isomerase [Ruegeria lacuscaerulensis]|uniref:2-hydroxychromene-2-carboxylate isomerase n=1 Tax=Ruegeria lacuscaerulensis TaxID=55218 RepID=UPI00147D9D40|nr:DsbA family protein [Ruegeria lacuscaerulensis]